jgi:hypothetical protein
MATSVYSSSKSKVRKNKQTNIKIVAAAYLRNYEIMILFSDNRMKLVDFAPAIAKYAVGDYADYAKPARFKKFIVENGNIVWGKNWDLVFPVEDVYTSSF